MLHEQYSAIVDRIQVKIYTDEKKVLELREAARKVFKERDDRLAGMTDESVETFYSCTLCQSFAPNHVCVITPERSGLCGAYNWLDGRAAFEINPTGPNQPIEKGRVVDEKLGQWEKVNEFVQGKSNRALERFSAYSMIKDPMTSCGCFECISAILPSTNGIMIVDRDYPEMTPCGMKFSTLAGTVGGGQQTPGFVGHSRQYIVSPKFISGDGGLARVVWMPKKLKEVLGERLRPSREGRRPRRGFRREDRRRERRHVRGRSPRFHDRERASRPFDGIHVLNERRFMADRPSRTQVAGGVGREAPGRPGHDAAAEAAHGAPDRRDQSAVLAAPRSRNCCSWRRRSRRSRSSSSSIPPAATPTRGSPSSTSSASSNRRSRPSAPG